MGAEWKQKKIGEGDPRKELHPGFQKKMHGKSVKKYAGGSVEKKNGGREVDSNIRKY